MVADLREGMTLCILMIGENVGWRVCSNAHIRWLKTPKFGKKEKEKDRDLF